MGKEIKRVAIYCRVSTEEQAVEGYSISAQLQTLRQYAELYNWEVSKEYVDEGISGKNITGRPAMQRLVNDVEKDKFQAILVWKISRLSRNMLDTLTLLDKFELHEVKFVSYSENFDTSTPIGRLVVQLMASIAEMERNTLSENVKLGMKQRALEGEWNGGVVFGYDNIDKALVVNQREAKIVKLIFQLYADGKGLKAIANHLNKAGFRTKRNHHFSIHGVAQILDNVIYNGKISWMKVEDWDKKRRKGKNSNPIIAQGKHEPIISDQVWNIVQSRRKSKSFKQRQSNKPFLLNSLLRCPTCSRGMVPSITTYKRKDGSKVKHRYYVCGAFQNKGSVACRSNAIKAYDAEDIVIEKINSFVSDKERLYNSIQNINSQSIDSLSKFKNELVDIQKDLFEIESLQNKYLEAFEQNTLPTSILQERLIEVTNKKKTLESRKSELNKDLSSEDVKVIKPELIEQILNHFLLVYKDASRDMKKYLFQQLIKTISLKQIDKKRRTIDKIELDFDFSDVNISKTFTLIHILYREMEGEEDEPLHSNSATDTKIPPYFMQFLPLLMIRFPPNDFESSIHLL
ncbi:recombinase family protein [Amphibacillus sp. Q70]|uniref:recombinase family protein n=1 Tax=Amphibacillus sp. Q70 TaxID=3453416 RepID=UPI003F863B82